MLNDIPQLAAGRQPRAVVRVNGTPIDPWVSWEVTSNTYYEADTFRVSFAANALPSYANAAWLSDQPEVFVEVLAGFPTDPDRPNAAELVSQIYGRVDDIDFDPFAGEIVLTGRDLTAAFIDARLTSQWANATSSEIATALAQAHGLTPVVTATSEKVGTFYKHDQVRMQADRSEWDMLAWLAREEGFVCFVTGQELHFEPDARETSEPYVIQWSAATDDRAAPSANVTHVSFSRAMTVSKGITVTASSPSLKKKTPTVMSYPSKPRAIQAGKSSPFGGVQTYYFTLPAGMDGTAVEQFAQKKYGEIVAHEMKLSARLPGDNLLTTKSVISMRGTGTPFDQVYYPNAITRTMSMDEGYTMTVAAKNTSPANEAVS